VGGLLRADISRYRIEEREPGKKGGGWGGGRGRPEERYVSVFPHWWYI